MSLPSYLANIKSSGIYRFVWDKSEVDNTDAQVLRLVVGYSEKGPFNTPVYIRTQQEFLKIFGSISKKLEKRGIYFHRLALQALTAGPILCLNLKKFSYDSEGKYSTVQGITLNPVKDKPLELKKLKVEDIYDTTRFWNLDPSTVVDAYDAKNKQICDKYISIVAADARENSNTIFVRGYSDKNYDVTIKEWYSTVSSEEMPSYFEGYEDLMISDFLVEVYVFSGQFTSDVISTTNLKKYFTEDADGNIILRQYITNAFGEKVDALSALADDDASNFVNVYRGVTLPFFKDSRDNYISLDLIFNGDYSIHKMMMYFNSAMLDDQEVFNVTNIITNGSNCIEVFEGSPATIGIKNGIFNIEAPVTATVSKAVWDGESSPKIWEFNTIEGDSAYINFYEYTLEDESYIPESETSKAQLIASGDKYSKWVAAGIVEGDRFLSKSGKMATVSQVIIDQDQEIVTIIFSRDIFEKDGQPVLYKYNHTLGDTTLNAQPVYILGYELAPNDLKPESLNQYDKLKWQQNIMSALTDYEGIRIALTNRKDCEYRYLVDTFEALVETECHAKLALICKEKDNAFGLLNFPSVQTFKTCPYTSFLDENNRFQVKYIADGCNKQKPASQMFTLVSEPNGASYVSYNTPLIFTDGTVKTCVPSAALVSNNFMDKYVTRKPYNIVAGANYGRISFSGLVGPDINYSRADLDILEPMGVNAMVYEPRKGTFINSNQTAKQKPETALSKINIRELVIFLQDEIEAMLRDYHWESNTVALRSLIKSRADAICENCQANGGIYDFYNKCDEENNPPEVIDNEMIVLSTSIEPARGAGKMVQELTLYKTGGLSSLIK